jgi:hypothetical protein
MTCWENTVLINSLHPQKVQSFPLVQWTPLCLVNMSWAGSKWLNMCTCADPDSTNGGGRNQNKTHKLNRSFGGSAIPLSGFELGNEYD